MAGASIFFLARSARLIASRGPIEFKAPATIVSNGDVAQRPLDRYLLFLADVRRRVPAGASIAVLGPDPGFLYGSFDHRVAIGQLPGNDVLPLRAVVDRGNEPPRFFAVFQTVSRDERYRPVASLPFGNLYELRQ